MDEFARTETERPTCWSLIHRWRCDEKEVDRLKRELAQASRLALQSKARVMEMFDARGGKAIVDNSSCYRPVIGQTSHLPDFKTIDVEVIETSSIFEPAFPSDGDALPSEAEALIEDPDTGGA